jgi:nitrogenase molybdenum-iron protein alpha/beta subunit
MGLQRFSPVGSGRMGVQHTLATVKGATLIEYGCMGHFNYALRNFAERFPDGCMMYSTHLSESDVTFGDMQRLRDAVDAIAEMTGPEAIFLTPSSTPELTGFDIMAAAAELSAEHPNIKFISFASGGFGATLCKGVDTSLDALAKALPEDFPRTSQPTFNIIGSNCDLYNYRADAEELVRLMRGCFNAAPICVLSSDTTLTGIKRMGGAHVNLVIRREGVGAAKRLRDRFGTPSVVGRPYGIEATVRWIRDIVAAIGLDADAVFVRREREEAAEAVKRAADSLHGAPELFIGAHADVAEGISAFCGAEMGLKIGATWCDDPYCRTEATPFFEENERIECLSRAKYILLADSELISHSGGKGVIIAGREGGRHGYSCDDAPLLGFRGAVNLARLIAEPPSLPDVFEMRGERGGGERGGRHGGHGGRHSEDHGGRSGMGDRRDRHGWR